MRNTTLRVKSETLQKLLSLGAELKSEKEVIDAYSKILPALKEESDQVSISENIPENLRPLANALYGAISAAD